MCGVCVCHKGGQSETLMQWLFLNGTAHVCPHSEQVCKACSSFRLSHTHTHHTPAHHTHILTDNTCSHFPAYLHPFQAPSSPRHSRQPSLHNTQPPPCQPRLTHCHTHCPSHTEPSHGITRVLQPTRNIHCTRSNHTRQTKDPCIDTVSVGPPIY